jgi:hypothetical protein
VRAALAALLLWAGGIAPAAEPGWGAVKGRVVWTGTDIPERKPIAVNKDVAHCLAKGPLLDESWVVSSENKGVRWAFVWLAPEPGRTDLPVHPGLKSVNDKSVVLDQPHCQFEPHALALRQGQELVARNSASIAHNVNWTGGLKNPGNNVILAPGKSFTITGLAADKYPVKVTCNLHPWMSAWVRVFDHPYFAVTEANGDFEIKQAPAGNWRLVVWQESAGYRGGREGRTGIPVTVPSAGVADLGSLGLAP